MAAAEAHDMKEVHRVLAHWTKEITQETVQAMGIMTAGHWGPCEARLQVKGNCRQCSELTGLTRPAVTLLAVTIST